VTSSALEPAIIVTGGAGFIGTTLSPHLLQRGLPVVAVDNLIEQVHPGRKRPDALPAGVELVEADVSDAATWDRILTRWRPELVLVLAAETGTGQSLTESTLHATTNVVGTTVMLDAFLRHDAMPQHLVLTSSRAVYGEGPWRTPAGSVIHPAPRSHAQLAAAEWDHRDADGALCTPIASNAGASQPNPSSIYGSTKLAQELVLRNWSASFSVPLSVFRLQNVYGPGQSPYNPYTGIVTLFHRLASRGQALDVYEDGNIGRDFVYIDDVVSALLAGIDEPPSGDAPRVLDVGTGVATTILEAATAIATAHGAPAPQISGKFRDGDVRYAFADVEPIGRELGWKPQWNFVDGSAALAEWLKAGGFLG
jgi:dTDP-L-rhamnose 4-epimerase